MKVINIELLKEYETIEIYPVGDLHIGDKSHDNKRLDELIKEIKEKPNN